MSQELLTPRIIIYPQGSIRPEHATDWISLPYFPGRTVFGDGSHPTTRLCAGAVDFICRQSIQNSVLDVGTGTGILARIARARGASFIAGTDICLDALSSARAHSDLDTHPVEILISDSTPDYLGERFNLVIANILEQPLCELASQLMAALAPQGVLLLSGFTRIQSPRLRVIFSNLGMIFESESHLNEWSLLMFRKP